MAELMYWITLDHTAVIHKVLGEWELVRIKDRVHFLSLCMCGYEQDASAVKANWLAVFNR